MKILLVEDDDALRSGLVAALEGEGWSVRSSGNVGAALPLLADTDVLVTDMRLPDMDGLDLLNKARTSNAQIEMIVMTGYGSVPTAVEAMRRGARAYLAKPFDPDELVLHLREVNRKLALRDAAAQGGRGELVGVSMAMRSVYGEIDAAANGLLPVLITGETGTGKEVAAQAVHKLSSCAAGPFVPVNLGALPRDLVESELFGHEKGAFTGAHARKRGRFEVAKGGTIFLDEVDSLPLELQPKLLRVLETRDVWPLGSERSIRSDARVIAATNAPLEDLVEASMFRKDLYFRLNVLRIEMPSLAERPEDIPVIARVLLNRIQERMAIAYPIQITSDALSEMMQKRWPGNVRELANYLERSVARAAMAEKGSAVDAMSVATVPISIGALRSQVMLPEGENLPFREARVRVIEDWTRSVIRMALEESGGNTTQAAKKLRMGRTAFLRLVKKYRLRG